MQVPVPRQWTSGEVVANAYMTAISQALNFLLAPPLCSLLYSSNAQSIPSGTWTAVGFQTELIDRDNAHSTSTNTSRITPQTPGWYLFSGCIVFPVTGGGASAGSRGVGLYQNGSRVVGTTAQVQVPAGVLENVGVAVPATPLYCNGSTDYVELFCFQDSGGALTLPYVAGATGSTFSAILRSQ
jgi:hypothetical protein